MSQITTLTFFRFSTFADKFWAFRMMQFAHRDLKSTPGQTFYRLMGSGKGLGFNPLPDWSVYALLQVWSDEADAEVFFEDSKIFSRYRSRSSERWTLFMTNVSVKGLWGGETPFTVTKNEFVGNEKFAVITRATIKPSRLLDFWRFVPRSQEPLASAGGLLFTKGIGELPIIQMATFSLWESDAAMKEYAYKSPQHREAISKTRELGWYREELFSRFRIVKSVGMWNGGEPFDAKN